MSTRHWPNDDLTELANLYRSDKGTVTNCAHGYTRIYQALLEPFRNAPLRIAEIGLVHPRTQTQQAASVLETGCPSLSMWSDFLPNAAIFGFDIVDFTALSGNRHRISQGDQGNRSDLTRFAQSAGAPFDVIIDDGSHASHHQQIALGTLFPFLAEGGMYIVEDLHFQPAEIELRDITKTRQFLAGLSTRQTGMRLALEQAEYGYLASQTTSIHFFDSISPHWPIDVSADALAIIRKRGKHPIFHVAP